jgi:RNA polymerase sigma-70 factor (ECF subfamily)
VRFRRGDDAIVREFATACDAGSIEVVRAMLTPNAVAVSDGGGKVTAALSPARGADAAARCVTELLQRGTAVSVEPVNGQAGVVLRRGGIVVGVVSLGLTGAKVSAVWIVLNPDKLRYWL